MRFDGSEMDAGMSGSEYIRGYEVLRGGYRETCIEILLSRLKFTGKMNAFVPICCVISDLAKSVQMLVDRSFSDIAPTRKRNIHRTEPIEERSQEEDRRSDFLHKFTIHSIEGNPRHIHREGISREIHYHPETPNNLEK